MIVQEIIEDYTTLVKTYSEAIDPKKFNREYEETNIQIEKEIEDEHLA